MARHFSVAPTLLAVLGGLHMWERVRAWPACGVYWLGQDSYFLSHTRLLAKHQLLGVAEVVCFRVLGEAKIPTSFWDVTGRVRETLPGCATSWGDTGKFADPFIKIDSHRLHIWDWGRREREAFELPVDWGVECSLKIFRRKCFLLLYF